MYGESKLNPDEHNGFITSHPPLVCNPSFRRRPTVLLGFDTCSARAGGSLYVCWISFLSVTMPPVNPHVSRWPIFNELYQLFGDPFLCNEPGVTTMVS